MNFFVGLGSITDQLSGVYECLVPEVGVGEVFSPKEVIYLLQFFMQVTGVLGVSLVLLAINWREQRRISLATQKYEPLKRGQFFRPGSTRYILTAASFIFLYL